MVSKSAMLDPRPTSEGDWLLVVSFLALFVLYVLTAIALELSHL
jgi:hypothetical protein